MAKKNKQISALKAKSQQPMPVAYVFTDDEERRRQKKDQDQETELQKSENETEMFEKIVDVVDPNPEKELLQRQALRTELQNQRRNNPNSTDVLRDLGENLQNMPILDAVNELVDNIEHDLTLNDGGDVVTILHTDKEFKDMKFYLRRKDRTKDYFNDLEKIKKKAKKNPGIL